MDAENYSFCPHKEEGCEWSSTHAGELGDHLQTCLYEPITCGVCDEKVRRLQLEAHQQSDCPLRQHICMLCQEAGAYRFIMGEHLATCPEVMVYCTNDGCSEMLKRQEIGKHKKECVHRLVRCTNKCGKEMKFINLTSHLEHRCPNRIITCSYCKNEGIYRFMTGEHLDDCPDQPLLCINEGCEERVKRKDMINHCYQHCQHQVIGCGNGCGQEMKRSDVGEHEKSHCPKRKATCAQCGKQDLSDLILGDHIKSCPEMKLPCYNEGCHETIKRCNMEKHQDICPHALVSCPYSSIGCYAAIKRYHLAQHKSDNIDHHLGLAIDRIHSQEEQINTFERRARDHQTSMEDEQHRMEERLNHLEAWIQEQQQDMEHERHNTRERLNGLETPNRPADMKLTFEQKMCAIVIVVGLLVYELSISPIAVPFIVLLVPCLLCCL